MKPGEKEIRTWIATEQDLGNKRFYKLLVGAVLNSSARIDKLSSWLLAISGASLALTISQLKSVSEFIDIGTLKILIILVLIPSVLAGFAQKFLAYLVAIHLDVTEGMDEKIQKLLNDYSEKEDLMEKRLADMEIDVNTDIDIQSGLQRFQQIIPWWMRTFRKGFLDKHVQDELLSYDQAAKKLFRQSTFLGFQILLLLAFFISLVAVIGTGN